MPNFIIVYLATLLPMIVLDAMWLTTMASRFYAPKLGHLLVGGFKLGPAAVFYLMYAAGVALFVVWPAMQAGQSLPKVFLLGAFLGLLSYGAYDLTNQATLRDWPLIVTIVDMAWGAFLTGFAATFSVYLIKLFN